MTPAATTRARLNALYLRWMKSRAARLVHHSWIAQLALMAIAFGLLRVLLFRFLKYPAEIYDHWSIGAGAYRRPVEFTCVLALCALMFAFRRRLGLKRGGPWLRRTAGMCLFFLWWGVAAGGFNYYTDQAYLLDRVLILALALLSVRYPPLAILAVAYAMLFLGQLGISAGDMETTDKLLLLYANVAIVAWLVLRALLPMRARTLLAFLLVLAAVAYMAPGWAKLTVSGSFEPLAWLLHDPLNCFMVTGFAHGWLDWAGSERVAQAAALFAVLSPLMALFTLFVELSAPLMVLFRRAALALLLLAIFMHIGIFSMTGIFFWKWIAVDTLLIGWLLSQRPRAPRARRRIALAMALAIAAFPLYTVPKFLGWLDTNVSEGYFFEVTTADGRTWRVHQKDFGPYDITFEQGAFHYANPEPVVSDLWGNAEWETGRELLDTHDPAAAREVIRARGKVAYNAKKAAELDAFLRRFFEHANARGDSMRWLDWIGPPHHMQVNSGAVRYDFSQPVTRVQVRFYRTYFDGEKVHVLDDRVIREIEISAPQ